jgi:putative membrane protein
MMQHWNDGASWFNWSWMIVMMLLLWGGAAAVIVYLVRGAQHHEASPRHQELNGIGILEERFARGEIDETEFKQRRAVLQGEG